MKREATKKVVTGIRAVRAGQLYVSEKISARMAEKFVDGRSGGDAANHKKVAASAIGNHILRRVRADLLKFVDDCNVCDDGFLAGRNRHT